MLIQIPKLLSLDMLFLSIYMIALSFYLIYRSTYCFKEHIDTQFILFRYILLTSVNTNRLRLRFGCFSTSIIELKKNICQQISTTFSHKKVGYKNTKMCKETISPSSFSFISLFFTLYNHV